MSGESLEELVERGRRERERAGSRWKTLEFQTRETAGTARQGLEKAGATVKWGGLAVVASAVLFRFLKIRRGFNTARWIWALAPGLVRTAAARFLDSSHLFGRRDSEKR
jgi:hypothetical protein